MKFSHVANARHYRTRTDEISHACAREILKHRPIDYFAAPLFYFAITDEI